MPLNVEYGKKIQAMKRLTLAKKLKRLTFIADRFITSSLLVLSFD
jgi:hypothetical protein